MQGWIDLFRALGRSLIEVVRAELDALQKDLEVSGRNLGRALAFLGCAAMLSFWVLGLLLFFLVVLLNLWLPLWAAALIVLILFAAPAAVLIWRGVVGLRKVDSPVGSVRKHVDNHLDWWQNGLLTPGSTPDLAAPGAEDPEEDLR